MRARTLHIFLVLTLLSTAGVSAEPLLRRGGIDTRFGPSLSLDVGAGVAGLDGFDSTRLAVVVTPRLRLLRRGETGIDLTLPVIAVPGDAPELDLAAEELEAGPGVGFAPGVELTFRVDCCSRFALFAGGGVWHEGARTTDFPGDDVFRVDAETSPLLTWGAAFERRLAARRTLRVEARVLTSFMGERTVTGEGFRRDLAGRSVTSVLLTVGLRFDF
jgi:hypothetical protein